MAPIMSSRVPRTMRATITPSNVAPAFAMAPFHVAERRLHCVGVVETEAHEAVLAFVGRSAEQPLTATGPPRLRQAVAACAAVRQR